METETNVTDLKLKIEQEFETLVGKLSKALNNYDGRLLSDIETAKQNVLTHAGVATETPAADAPVETPAV